MPSDREKKACPSAGSSPLRQCRRLHPQRRAQRLSRPRQGGSPQRQHRQQQDEQGNGGTAASLNGGCAAPSGGQRQHPEEQRPRRGGQRQAGAARQKAHRPAPQAQVVGKRENAGQQGKDGKPPHHGRRPAPRTPPCPKLQAQKRHAHQADNEQIEQQEGPAAPLERRRKFQQVPKAHGAARRSPDQSRPGRPSGPHTIPPRVFVKQAPPPAPRKGGRPFSNGAPFRRPSPLCGRASCGLRAKKGPLS